MVTALLGLFPQAPYRNVALQCLTEVSRLWQLLPHTEQSGCCRAHQLDMLQDSCAVLAST